MRRREFIALLGGAAVASPLSARAQAKPVIGYLSGGNPEWVSHLTAIFREGLKRAGYIEGQNVEVDYRWAEAQLDRLPGFAADLVRRRVDLIVAVGGDQSVFAARAATSTIPIVFLLGSDPVKLGFTASLNRPGGNMTGVMQLTTSLEAKRLELLREAAPNATLIAALVNPNRPQVETQVKEIEAAAQAVGQQLVVIRARQEREIDAAFATIAKQRAGALLVASDAFFTQRREQVVALATRHAIPSIYQWREFVAVGGLMSYGTSLSDAYQDVIAYTVRIIKGEKPADLPVRQTSKVELVVNLKTAKSLNLNLPLALLGRADEVIE
jgi:putative tryptophan/tyrosine transport system substrate-binding protein